MEIKIDPPSLSATAHFGPLSAYRQPEQSITLTASVSDVRLVVRRGMYARSTEVNLTREEFAAVLKMAREVLRFPLGQKGGAS